MPFITPLPVHSDAKSENLKYSLKIWKSIIYLGMLAETVKKKTEKDCAKKGQISKIVINIESNFLF